VEAGNEETQRALNSQGGRADDRGVQALYAIRSLEYRYPDGHAALAGVDLTIYPGERIALVGQNGAGKTTLVKHLNGLHRPRSGSVSYKGKPLDGHHLSSARLQVGMLFQDPDDQLFCNTLDEDTAFGPRNQGLSRSEIENRVLAALRQLGLEQLRYKPPHHLSYGQKKRAAFATLLAMNPEVLVLDEPTANLDPKQEKLFVDLLRDYSGTLICISHDLPFLYGLCSRAVVLESGRIHHDFSMQDLVTHRDYLREHGLDFTFRLSCCRDDGEHHEGHHVHSTASAAHALLPGHHDETADESSSQALIRLQDYSYRYADGTWGVRQAGIAIAEGESVAIAGENGAGKSTLVSCLAGILEGSGDYTLDGKPVAGSVRKELWRHIGLVFQDPADQLFCPSCREEVAFGPRQLRLSAAETRARVAEALALVRLAGFEDRVPHHLSAGERKRLALAAVLSMRPRVLILDEPTANLDPRSEELLCEILRQLKVTKILISHDIDIISVLCERTIVMHGGRLVRDYPTNVFLHDEQLVSINGLDYTFKNACCREIVRLQHAAA
jgi:energy-coupling factor transport system ATP-binding protein